MTKTFIVSAARTPIGRLSGSLASFSAAELGGVAIGAALQRAGLEPSASTTSSWDRCCRPGPGRTRPAKPRWRAESR